MTKIMLKSIRPNELALGVIDRESKDYKMLCTSIAARGQIGAITVRRIEDRGLIYYEIIDGYRRYQAVKDLGHSWIDAEVVTLADDQILTAQIIRSVHKVETKPMEYARQLKRLLTVNPVMAATDLANKLGKTTHWIKCRLSLNDLTPVAGDLVDQGRIKLTNAYNLARLPSNEQQHFLRTAEQWHPSQFSRAVDKRIRKLHAERHKTKRCTRCMNGLEGINIDSHLRDDLKLVRVPILKCRCGRLFSSYRKGCPCKYCFQWPTKTILSPKEWADMNRVTTLAAGGVVKKSLNSKELLEAINTMKQRMEEEAEADAFKAITGRDMLYGKRRYPPVKAPEPEGGPLLRPGWDNVTKGQAEYAYCRGDILVLYSQGSWAIDHPRVQKIGNLSFITVVEAQEFVEEHFDA